MTGGTTALIIIGRNEGERLDRCLRSVGGRYPLIYVDSGSTDGSVALAESMGATVISLDHGTPFTAARARNAGLARLAAEAITPRYVQMIDGDCELQSNWIEAATAAIEADDSLAIVFGRRRERFRDRSIYNWLCDVEWAVPPGPATACGGDALFLYDAIAAAGGYRASMIAGEDPDLSIRLRQAGWSILCIDVDMTLHDAAISRFGQWWRRTVRAGHAFAEVAALHPGKREARSYALARRRIIVWGVLPIAGLLLGTGLTIGGEASAGLRIAGAVIVILAAQLLRMTLREALRFPPARAFGFAAFLVIGKFAEAAGMIRYMWERVTGKRSTLIEYKDVAAR